MTINLKKELRLLPMAFLLVLFLSVCGLSSSVYAQEVYTENVIQPMTSNNSPSPQVASSSNFFDEYQYMSYKVFNGVKNGGKEDAWAVKPGAITGWVSLDFGADNLKTIAKYTITSYDYPDSNNYAPKSWTFEGSSNGQDWVILDKREEQVNWKRAETREYAFSNSVAYRYYKVNISSINGIIQSRVAIAEIEMMELANRPSIDAPTNLVAVGGDSKVDLSWTAVSGATNYNIKRSTTPGGPYTTVASSVYGTTYKDTTVINGTTYYYVVTAVNGPVESANSNEASATPQAPVTPPPTGRAILVVTLDTGLEKEFDLSMTEVNTFIAWYEGRATGTGPASYAIDKHDNNKGPFKSRKDYVIFNKILTYEVNEYIPVSK
ncbi:discoidin domain-containing protein [Paenibacillus ehimensis]|uniref:discoidin domain-containing protein n=1 Tax=Paenibacillus ehimensis TaxID=79264 RepID=UPI003D2C1493